MQSEARSAFPNSAVADVGPFEPELSPGAPLQPFKIRAYMNLSGVLNQKDESAELKFPLPETEVPNIENYRTRQHATYLWPDLTETVAHLQLPPGWRPAELPAPFNYDSDGARFTASWSLDKDTLTATCSAVIKHDLFQPADFVDVGNAVTNLKEWASKSLILAKTGSAVAMQPQTVDDLVNALTVMPTGEGELNLIDSKFPSSGNIAARRAALERIPRISFHPITR